MGFYRIAKNFSILLIGICSLSTQEVTPFSYFNYKRMGSSTYTAIAIKQ